MSADRRLVSDAHTHLSKRRSAGWLQFLLPAEVQIVGIEDAPRQTHAFTHDVVLFKPVETHSSAASWTMTITVWHVQYDTKGHSKLRRLRWSYHCRVSCVCFFLSLMIWLMVFLEEEMLCLISRSGLKSWSSSEDGVSLLSSASMDYTQRHQRHFSYCVGAQTIREHKKRVCLKKNVCVNISQIKMRIKVKLFDINV